MGFKTGQGGINEGIVHHSRPDSVILAYRHGKGVLVGDIHGHKRHNQEMEKEIKGCPKEDAGCVWLIIIAAASVIIALLI